MSGKSELYASKCGLLNFHRRELRAALKQAREHVSDSYTLRRIDSALAITGTSDAEDTEQAQELLRETEHE